MSEIEFIFCINPGRSGSKYLAELFKDHPEVAAYHEPQPIMNREPMRNWLKGEKLMLQQMVDAKWQQIRKSKGDKPIYLESNHCFIKGFGWEIMRLVPHQKLMVLILERNRSDVVKSLLKINCTPVGLLGAEWLIQPAIKGIGRVPLHQYLFFRAMCFFERYYNLINHKLGKRLPDLLKAYKTRLLYRYYDWTYELGSRFRQKFPGVTYKEVTLANLNDADWLKGFCSELGIGFTDEMCHKLCIKVNEVPGKAG